MPPERATDRAMTARALQRSEYQQASECLGRAFHDDPLAIHFFPDDATRAQRFGAFTLFAMSLFAHHGRIVTTDPIHGAALWQKPSPPKGTLLSNTWVAVRMAWVARSAFGRIASMGQATLHHHPPVPHWYLAVLGTEPAAQGHGIGSEQMRETLEECDRQGTVAYLESSKETNIPFYERHGFRVDGEIKPPGCPTLWAMTRNPA
jgi:ribosomal protein S18 acetylase RimI-like enzyme